MNRSRRAFLASLAAAAVGCRGAMGLAGPAGRDGVGVQGPPGPQGPPPPLEPGAVKKLSDYGVTWIGDETTKVQAAITDVALYGGTIDCEGKPLTVTAPLIIPATSQLIGQQRGLKIVNAMTGGITAAGDFPIFKAAPNLLVLFFTLEDVQLQGLQPTRTQPLVDYAGMSQFRFRDSWLFAPGGDGFRAVGNLNGAAPYYGSWEGCLIGCARGIVAQASAGMATGPNSNAIRTTRFNGTVGVEIGPDCQAWSIEQNQFEGTVVGIRANGTRLLVGDGNRFEGGVGQVGIQLGPNSDGKIGRQYWSVAKRIAADPALDLARWVLDAQPENQ